MKLIHKDTQTTRTNVFKKSSYSIRKLIEKLEDLEKFVGSDAEIYTLNCGCEEGIKWVTISKFNDKPCIVINKRGE